MIATDDIGACVALALEQPSAFMGEVLEIAADELTMDGIGEVLSRVIGREVPAHPFGRCQSSSLAGSAHLSV